MSVSNPQMPPSPGRRGCCGTGALIPGSDPPCRPADIVLVMDRSCSMDQRRMPFAKNAARTLVQRLTDGEVLGCGTRMGLVSFAAEASRDVPLTDDPVALRRAISALCGCGSTNHRAALEMAEATLGPGEARRQIVILFTDGVTTLGGDATGVTDRMKAAGVEIFCIGLMDDPLLLGRWASAPFETHVSITENPWELDALFRRTAEQLAVCCDRCPPVPGFSLTGCQDALRVRLCGAHLTELGRIVQLDVTLKDVCPGKRVAASILLWELDPWGREYFRGARHLVIPAQEGESCRDVHLDCIPFSLPEALNPGGERFCCPRRFQAQVIANYVDTDFVRCEARTCPCCGDRCTCCGDC